MKIELIARWTKYKNDRESIEERKINRVIGKDLEDDEDTYNNSTYIEYGPITLDTDRIWGWNRFDDEHTTIRTERESYIIKTPYEIFSTFYYFVTNEGEAKKPEHFQFAHQEYK